MDVRVGMVGCGRIARVHLDNLLAINGVSVVGIYDPFIDKESAKEFNLCIVESLEALCAFSLDAVFICSPSELHCQHIQYFAKRGISIFCEKPIGLNLTEINQTLKCLRETKVNCQIGFNRRFDKNFKALKEKMTVSPQLIRITSRDPEPPPKEYLHNNGFLFLDMSIHDFDMARFISGSDVSSVYAVGSALVDSSLEDLNQIDTAIIKLKHENGAISVIDNSRQALYGYDQRIEVFSNKESFIAENEYETNVKLFTKDGMQRSKNKWFFLDRYTEAYRNQLLDFIDNIRFKRPMSVNAFDGYQAVKIALAATRSCLESKVVNL